MYRQRHFQILVDRYKYVSKRQHILVKENLTEDLVGQNANQAKSEYQANIDEIRHLKKEFFKVKRKLIICRLKRQQFY